MTQQDSYIYLKFEFTWAQQGQTEKGRAGEVSSAAGDLVKATLETYKFLISARHKRDSFIIYIFFLREEIANKKNIVTLVTI